MFSRKFILFRESEKIPEKYKLAKPPEIF